VIAIRYAGLLKKLGNLKKNITINRGIFRELIEDESKEEEEAQRLDEIERIEELKRNKGDTNKEAWDEVPEKQEEGGDDEDKEQQAVKQVEVERLPRVKKPVGDVLEDILKMEIGAKNVETLQGVNAKELETQLLDCLSKVKI